ncbi:MAG: hypothetical protein HUJ26_18930 [Planctomycetaceae bacterium]|nr:hypothetical protein [Planctomycetaceae bacterium]
MKFSEFMDSTLSSHPIILQVNDSAKERITSLIECQIEEVQHRAEDAGIELTPKYQLRVGKREPDKFMLRPVGEGEPDTLIRMLQEQIEQHQDEAEISIMLLGLKG